MTACRHASFIDGDLFFSMLFGSERFHPYLGKLFIASAIDVLGSSSLSGTEADLSFAESEAEGQDTKKGGRERGEGQGQRAAATLGESKKTLCETQTRREVRIAVHLVKILKPLVEGRKDSFSRFCEAEAADLVSRSLGPLILRELGSTYKRAAREFLGGLGGLAASFDKRRARVQRQADVAGAAIQGMKLGKSFMDVYASSGPSPGSTPGTPHGQTGGKRGRAAGFFNRNASAPSLSCPRPVPGGSKSSSADTTLPPSQPPSSSASISTVSTTPENLTPEAMHYPATAPVGGKEGGPASSTARTGAGVGRAGKASKEAELEADGLPRLVSITWKLAAYDIGETVGRACGKVLSDNSVTREERQVRAEGLMALGRAFKERSRQALAKAGGAVDYQKEWEALDRQFMHRYESSTSIHTMASSNSSPSFPTDLQQKQYDQPFSEELLAEERGEEEAAGIVL
uniref:DNAJ-containing protein X-domain domain-containing protein n=1 Tax=Nannochloropsis gaditana (strain CCMP526) TaxID=1093141 RepID=I2CQQ5_NANGC